MVEIVLKMMILNSNVINEKFERNDVLIVWRVGICEIGFDVILCFKKFLL